MDESATSSAMLRLQDILDQDLDALLDQLGRNPDAMVAVNRAITVLIPSIRFNALVDLDEVGGLWETIRSDDNITDLVLDYTTSLVFRADADLNGGWPALARALADAWGCFNPREIDSAYSVVHVAEENERFVTPGEMSKLLLANPWLAGLYFIRMSSYSRRLMRDSAVRAAQEWNQQQDRRTEAEG